MDTICVSKENGRFELKPITDCFWELPDGEYDVTVKRHRKHRTSKQNAYLWGVAYPYLLQGFIDAGWDEITSIDQIHEICKAKFLTKEAVNKHTGELISFPLSTAKMDTFQFGTYVDQIIGFALNNLNVVIPQPEYELNNN